MDVKRCVGRKRTNQTEDSTEGAAEHVATCTTSATVSDQLLVFSFKDSSASSDRLLNSCVGKDELKCWKHFAFSVHRSDSGHSRQLEQAPDERV